MHDVVTSQDFEPHPIECKDTHAANVPLCVDLDGTLTRSDLLIESVLALVRRNPAYLFLLPLWLSRGRAALKHEVARRTEIDVTILPYDARVLALLQNANTRQRILCTASDAKFAQLVATHIGGFDAVLASDGAHNMGGTNKAAALVARFGERGFDYAGNANVDLKVWRHARHAIVVNASASLAKRAARSTPIATVIAREPARLQTWMRALRLHQWLKNLLVFLPLLAAHRLLDASSALSATAAFFCFGLCASGVYILNDLLDLEADRNHPRKCRRPFAAGTLALQSGLIAAPLLTLAAFGCALALSPRFAFVLIGYYLLTLAYSFALKRVAMLDTVVLAALYTVRIVAGTVVIRAPLSFWLLAFSMFLFLSLAMIKRYTELHIVAQSGRNRADGRGYEVDDLSLIQSLGGSSGYLAVLVLALYINSTASEALYRHQQILWLLCPLLLYWISRIWLKTHRGLMHDDPVVFALTDRVSRIVLLACAAVVLGAI